MPANRHLSETASRRAPINPEIWVVLAAFVALLAKIYCALMTIGTDDITLFFNYAKSIQIHGLAQTYEHVQMFNHTPLTAIFIHALYNLPTTGFPFGIRFPGILADFFSMLALLWLRKKTARIPIWALLIFALSPVSFMVSGYQGNIDPVVTMFLLFAACATVANRPVLSGVLFGLACNVKIIPLLFSPIFFFFWMHRKRALAFTLTVTAVVFIGFAWPIFHVPAAFYRNVFSYNGYWGIWGISYWIREMHFAAAQPIECIRQTLFERTTGLILKLGIIAASLTLAWRRRKLDALSFMQTLAIVWVVLFVLMPGGSPSYMVWIAPFLLVYSARWYVVVTAATTPYLFFFYNVISHGMPWHFGLSTNSTTPLWISWTAWPWFALIACLVSIWRAREKPLTANSNP